MAKRGESAGGSTGSLISDGKLAQREFRRLREANKTSSRECIYCRTKTGPFKKREHVIPEALGTFGTDTWTLIGVVCSECNRYFGDNLEIYFNRGSTEAVKRFEHGLKPKDEASDILASRMSVVSVSQESKGMRFSPITHRPLPQVGLLRAGTKGDRDFFLLAELEAMSTVDSSKYDITNGIWASPETEAHLNRFNSALSRLGLPLLEKGRGPRIESHRLELEYAIKIDQPILRTAAKVAFNYMAKVRGAAYCLKPDFNAVRAFIRYATPPPFPAVVPKPGPMFPYDKVARKKLVGHVIALKTEGRGATIKARVSFFNGFTYAVTLATLCTAELRPDVAHLFDFRNKRVLPLDQIDEDFGL